MAKEKKATTNAVDVEPISAEHCVTVLQERGYDTQAIYSYACAARSWHKKGSPEFIIWKEVEAMTSVSSLTK